MTRFAHVCAAIGALGCSTFLPADSASLSGVGSQSTEGLGSYGAVIDYAPGAGAGVLTVTLTNGSDPGNGGFLTGFVFNFVSSDPEATAILLPGGTHSFNFYAGNASPFGSFAAGAALGNSFNGGGSPQAGIPVGGTGSFSFSIIASDAATLTAADFGVGPNAHDFLVRFKGFNNGGSDKVPATGVCPCDLNFDTLINELDVQVVLDAWGDNPGSPADKNGDGVVDGADLGLVLECWRDCLTPN